MKRIKVLLVALILCINVAFALPAWADRGKLMKSPDYTEVTQAIAALLAEDAPTTTGLKPAEIQQKLADLQLQKYILETADGRAQCANQTGKTLAIYAESKKATGTQPPALYFLADGQVTDDDFVCKGVYLPAGTTVSYSLADPKGQALAEAIAIKIVNGTQLIATADPETGVIAFNLHPAQTFKAGEGTWEVPALTQEELAAQTPNAPVD